MKGTGGNGLGCISSLVPCRPAETVLPVGRALLTRPTKAKGNPKRQRGTSGEQSDPSLTLRVTKPIASQSRLLSGASLLPVYPLVTGRSARPTGTACPYYGTTDSSRICHRRVSVTARGNEGNAINRDDADRWWKSLRGPPTSGKDQGRSRVSEVSPDFSPGIVTRSVSEE